MKQALLWLIRLYKRYLSPALPPSCRFYPTCSQYAYEAVEKHGALAGTLLAIWRVLRCNPFCRGGYDPVPEAFGDAFIRWRRADGADDGGTDATAYQ
ncbi:MAG: membrane protein insertion efficiency factor YidD [Clostridia bacterium]|nr:membrane protein insertion efficiency factor YidD [Clostridia bacterium]